MKKIQFTKMHGIGNDFIILEKKHLDEIGQDLSKTFVKNICDRNFGIGSDGLLIVDSGKKIEFKYVMFNPDGSEAEMCGNGIRCYMKYLKDNSLTIKNKIDVETGAGILNLELDGLLVKVDMGTPNFSKENIGLLKNENTINSSGRDFSFFPVSVGNPHAVIFLEENLNEFDLNKYGKPIESNTNYFKNKINVEFINIISETEIDFRVYERGAGETLACGTGACASIIAGIKKGLLKPNKEIKVNLKGGKLYISWSGLDSDSVIMKGPAETTFSGYYFIK